MGNLKEKKGISLIVLVITIIVMIILAAAIILSISNSGIMSKANKAKTDSDTANLKEYVNVLEAEWELGTKETSKAAYVNSKLEEKGYTSAYMTNDEILYTNLSTNVTEALKNGLEIGDRVTGYAPAKASIVTTGVENQTPEGGLEPTPEYTPQTVNSKEFAIWRVIGINDDGQIEIVPDIDSSSPTIKISGYVGQSTEKYNALKLSDICAELYSVEGKGTARSINIEDVNKVLNYTGPKGGYTSTLDSKWHDTDRAFTLSELRQTRRCCFVL